MKNNNWIWIVLIVIIVLSTNTLDNKKEFSKKDGITIRPEINTINNIKKSTILITPPLNCIPGTQYGTGISTCYDGWRDMHFDNAQYTVSYKFTTCDDSEILSSGVIQSNNRKTETCPPDKWCHYIYANYDCSGGVPNGCPSGTVKCSDGNCKSDCSTTTSECEFYQEGTYPNCKISTMAWVIGGIFVFMMFMVMMR